MKPVLDKGVQVWLDDVLRYAETDERLLAILEVVLQRYDTYGVKLNPEKCTFISYSTIWCGKRISSEGISHCDSRAQGLCEMEIPKTAAEPQNVLCAVNWMRNNIPNYTTLVKDLHEVLEAGGMSTDGKKSIIENGTNGTSERSLGRMRPIRMHHMITRELYVYCGSFRGSMLRWATIEKEAYAIAETCKRLEYLLVSAEGFHIFTEHRNLQSIFDPRSIDNAMARYRADKLQRWAMVLQKKSLDIPWSMWPVQKTSGVDETRDIQQKEIRTHEDPKFVMDKQRLLWTDERGPHAGPSVHRGGNTTFDILSKYVTWTTIKNDVKNFVNKSLHCLVANGQRSPQPYGETLHATKPNEVLHFAMLNGWTYDVQELVEPFSIITRHVTSLKFFRERYLGVSQDLKDYVVYANGGNLVSQFLECPLNPDNHQWEVLVQWIGLDDTENSWEPASLLMEDVPTLLRKWVNTEPKAADMRSFLHIETSRRRGK
uniref:PREDICTED: polyproteinlike putative n=2 Tax=Albugo laibachii Nc14 TaxID=890382 RepID=F0W6K2_9STRA|nr:PREDICTED: polyproteinlike putative [Albugo laibachii Nc14]|eukprot:CCA16747.1 PREDICTED: polyproteinlike putative [Albugo laibachii Nc14]